jgi:hypothetical protein
VGWSQTLDATAFLIDQYKRIAADGRAGRVGQAPQLLRCFDVAGKQDNAGGLGIRQERTLIGREVEAR